MTRPNRLRLKNGVIYTFLRLASTEKGGKLLVKIITYGKGEMSASTSTCVRPPVLQEKKFSHSIKKNKGPFKLTPTPATFKFEIDMAPYEVGYLYINVSGEATLDYVSAVYAANE